jgi:hypothetical protein
LKKPSARRPGFPSWSWTGWAGKVEWGIDEQQWKSLRVDPDIELAIELHDGRVLEWEEYQNSYRELNFASYLEPKIRISTWTTQLRDVRKKIDIFGKLEYEATVDLEDGCYLHWRFGPTTDKELTNPSYIGIHLGHIDVTDVWCPTGPAILVVDTMGDAMERVGFGWIDQHQYKYYLQDGKWEHEDKLMPPLLENPIYARHPMLQKSRQEFWLR